MLGRTNLVSLALVAVSSFTACSSDTTTTTTPAPVATTVDGLSGKITSDTTWADGTKLGGVIQIPEGVTVTIAPGAKITCANPVQIQIGGTLKVDSEAAHASISCSSWTGILVATNGTVDANGLDISNAAVGVEVAANAKLASLKNSTINTTVRPWTVRANAVLTLDHVAATVPTTLGPSDSSVSEVYGTLNASFLTYNSQTNEGIMAKDGGNITISDSTLTSENGLDLVSSYSGGAINVSYSTMTGAHCGLHMQGTKSLTVDHVTSVDKDIYGVTIYGADAVTITNSNFGGSVAWLDLQGDHGTMTLNGVFHSGNAIVMNTQTFADTATATATVAAATPRAN